MGIIAHLSKVVKSCRFIALFCGNVVRYAPYWGENAELLERVEAKGECSGLCWALGQA